MVFKFLRMDEAVDQKKEKLEEGKKRTNPKDLQRTQNMDWKYYKNSNESDFHKYFNIDRLFTKKISS